MELIQNAGTKTFLGLCCVVLSYFRDAMNEVFIILLGVLILDYLTGIINGLLNGGFSLEKALKGVVKKLSYGFVVALGFVIDFLIFYLASMGYPALGFTGIFGVAVCIYLIGTEGFSTIQNVLQIGVPAPSWLQKAFGLMRDNAGKLVKLTDAAVTLGGDPSV